MKTLRELAGTFIGEFNAAVMFRIFLGIYSVVTGDHVYWTFEDYMILAGWLTFTMVMTYIGWMQRLNAARTDFSLPRMLCFHP